MSKVRVTLELDSQHVALLNAKAVLRGWNKWHSGEGEPPQMDVADAVAWLVLMEAKGGKEGEIHAATPPMWRTGTLQLIHEERRVYNEAGQQISGPKLVNADERGKRGSR